MRLTTAVLMLLVPGVAIGQDKWVEMTLKGHASIVEPYLSALSKCEAPAFDEDAAMSEAFKSFPDLPLPTRDEFETAEAFQRRLDPVLARNEESARKRADLVSEMRRKHAREAEQAKQLASELSSQYPGTLYVMFPTRASRYNIDEQRFDSFSTPGPRLGQAPYGLANMDLALVLEKFHCPNIDLAKKIRAVSDDGNLWAAVKITNAHIKIDKGNDVIGKSSKELLVDSIPPAPELVARVVGEYFSPGSNQRAPYTPNTTAPGLFCGMP